MTNPYLIPALEASPQTIERIVMAVDPSDWDRVTDEDRFSFREAVAHMADWEPIMRGRIELALREPGATITPLDEEARAIEMNYASSDPLEEAQKFSDERRITVDLIKEIEDFSVPVNHPQIGDLTVGDLCMILVGHDSYHVEHFSQYLVGSGTDKEG
jgi:hypothetical protein